MDVLTSGDLILDVDPHNRKAHVYKLDLPFRVELTPTETRLLLYLWRNSERLIPYRKVLYDVWGNHYVRGNLYIRILTLRKKLQCLNAAKTIQTHRKVGYIYSPPGSTKGNRRASDLRALEYI